MLTVGNDITSTPIDIKTGLIDGDGAAYTLTLDEDYLIQNVGAENIYVSERPSMPADLSGPWHLLKAFGGALLVTPSANGMWARTVSLPSYVSATMSE